MKYALNINGEWQNLTKTDNKRNLFGYKFAFLNCEDWVKDKGRVLDKRGHFRHGLKPGSLCIDAREKKYMIVIHRSALYLMLI